MKSLEAEGDPPGSVESYFFEFIKINMKRISTVVSDKSAPAGLCQEIPRNEEDPDCPMFCYQQLCSVCGSAYGVVVQCKDLKAPALRISSWPASRDH